jgi:hypothetical protein
MKLVACKVIINALRKYKVYTADNLNPASQHNHDKRMTDALVNLPRPDLVTVIGWNTHNLVPASLRHVMICVRL